MEISKKLYELRRISGLSQEAAAERAQISRIALTRYENGSRTPKADILNRLAKCYGVSVDSILGDDVDGSTSESTKKAATGIGNGSVDESLIRALVGLSQSENQRVLDFVAGIKAKREVLSSPSPSDQK